MYIMPFAVFLKIACPHRLRAWLSRWRGWKGLLDPKAQCRPLTKNNHSVNEQLLEVYSNTFYLTVAGFPRMGTAKHFKNRKGKTFLGHTLQRITQWESLGCPLGRQALNRREQQKACFPNGFQWFWLYSSLLLNATQAAARKPCFFNDFQVFHIGCSVIFFLRRKWKKLVFYWFYKGFDYILP